MNDYEKQKQKLADEPLKTAPRETESSYPASIEGMSERWRKIRQQRREEDGQPPRSFVERNYLAVGIGIALLIIALLTVIGGFAFLIWRAQ